MLTGKPAGGYLVVALARLKPAPAKLRSHGAIDTITFGQYSAQHDRQAAGR